MHLEEPRLTGPQALLKRATDALVSAVGLVLISPVMLLISHRHSHDLPRAGAVHPGAGGARW